jgi:BASS family bile acid:Na+ symporter
MTEILETLAGLSVLVFVISSMLSMGLSLTVKQIVEPLKNIRLVILALVANFVLVPLVAYLITLVLPLDESVEIGLILLSTAAGAPFLPKLVEVAKGNIAFSVGLMVLLMVVTIIYLPLVLPLLLSDVAVNPWDIAQSLIVLMLFPLAIGTIMAVVGVSPDGEHYVVNVPKEINQSGQGWIQARFLRTENVSNVPVVQPPPLP